MSEKKKYTVTFYWHTYADVVVEAANEEEAIVFARDKDLTNQIMRNLQEDDQTRVGELPKKGK